MKSFAPLHRALLWLVLATFVGPAANGQTGFGNRPRNVFQVNLTSQWDIPLSDPVKLIEIGKIADANHNSLIEVIASRDPNNYKRQLRVTHWDGLRFSSNSDIEFLGIVADALVTGRFRPTATPATTAPANTQGQPKKHPGGTPPQQVVTAEGIYVWNGKGLTRLFTAPPNLKLAMILDAAPDLLVTGFGDQSEACQIGDTEWHPVTANPPADSAGYVHYGVGMTAFPGSEKMILGAGVRFVQAVFNGKMKWMIGVAQGKAVDTTNSPTVETTTGDRLVIYTLRSGKKDQTFWGSKFDDYEEAWRSSPFPGHILDVRVGDPKNNGKDGVLVLSTQNNDKERHLTFFAPGNGSPR